METVKLNVSGKLIEVEKSTLIKSGYFNTLLNGNFKKPEEPIFVSCDIDAFKEIIRFLRFNTEIDKKFQPEVEYFQVPYEFEEKDQNSDNTQKLLNIFAHIRDYRTLCGDRSDIGFEYVCRNVLDIKSEVLHAQLIQSIRNDYKKLSKK